MKCRAYPAEMQLLFASCRLHVGDGVPRSAQDSFFRAAKKGLRSVSGTLIERCGVVYPRGVGRRHGRIGVVLLLALTLDGCTARRPRKVALLGYRSTSGGVPELDRRLGVRLRFEGDPAPVILVQGDLQK